MDNVYYLKDDLKIKITKDLNLNWSQIVSLDKKRKEY